MSRATSRVVIMQRKKKWADFVTGQEVPEAERDDINNALDQVTDYVFEILQTSNFAQEIHECQ